MLRIRHVVTFAYRRWKTNVIIVQIWDLYIFRSRAWKWSLRHHVSCLRCLPPPGAGAFFSDRVKSSEVAAADPQRAEDSLINIVTQCQHISCSMFCDITVTSWPPSWASWWPSPSWSAAWPASTWTRGRRWCTAASRAASSASLWRLTEIREQDGECCFTINYNFYDDTLSILRPANNRYKAY